MHPTNERLVGTAGVVSMRDSRPGGIGVGFDLSKHVPAKAYERASLLPNKIVPHKFSTSAYERIYG